MQEERAVDALCWHQRPELPAASSSSRLQPGFPFAPFPLVPLVMPHRRGAHSRHLLPGTHHLLAAIRNAVSGPCPLSAWFKLPGAGGSAEAFYISHFLS